MPTQPLELALYIFLLFPGFAFALIRSTHRPTINRSTFKETTTAVFVSAISLGIVIVPVSVVALFIPKLADIVRLIALEPATLLRETFGAALLAAAIGLVLTTLIGAMLGTERVHNLLYTDRGSDRQASAWRNSFTAINGAEVYVGIELTDGSWIEGTLYTYDLSGDDKPDRSLTITGPIQHRPNGVDSVAELKGYSLVVVSDRNIRFLTVSYREPADGSHPTEPDPAHASSWNSTTPLISTD